MKSKSFDLGKYLPQHRGIKTLVVIFSVMWLLGLRWSLTHADLSIQSSLDNVMQTIQELHITVDGTAKAQDKIRLNKDGIYIDSTLLGGTDQGVLKLNTNGYITRDLVKTNNIASDAINGTHITNGSILLQHLGFPYPPTINNTINITCPAGQVMWGVTAGVPVCVPATTANGDCWVGSYIQGRDSNGQLICDTDNGGINSPGGGLRHPVATSTDIFYGTLADDLNGNIGIGLNAPLAKLHVSPSFRVGTDILDVANTKVGINTISPTANLHVNGTVRFASYAGNGTRRIGVDANGNLLVLGASYFNDSQWTKNGSAIYYNIGNVGIGTTTPSEKLEVVGDVKAQGFPQSSDRRLKKDINPLHDTLDKILALQPVSFIWRNNNKTDIGFIAQDVEKIFPDLVSTDDKWYKSVEYSNLLAPVVGALQEMHTTLVTTSDKYAANEKRIDELEQKMQEFENQLKK